MPVTIHPNQALPNTADLSDIPGDKSISHRLALLGALADGPSTIHNFLRSDDCLNTLAIIQQLGVPVTDTDTTITIHGVGLHGLRPAKKALNVGNSGTAIRLLTGVLAAQTFASTLTGDASIQSRPMARVTQPLALMGACIDSEYAPLHIPGGAVLSGLDYTLPIPSAQVKSALLFAGLYANSPTHIHEPIPCRDHTERLFQHFHIPLTRSQTTITLIPPTHISSPTPPIVVPRDLSSAIFFIALGLLTQKTWTFEHIGVNPTRRAGLDHLMAMGGQIQCQASNTGAEPTAALTLQPSTLKSAPIAAESVANLIDEVPILAITTLCAGQPFRIRNAAELRVKESDRLATIAQLATALGATVREYPDGIDIEPPAAFLDFEYDCHFDHRLAMSASIAAIATGVRATIHGCESIQTSFPTFFTLLDTLGIAYTKT
jgi:3-phosphoshikimate 1-carboxyvinyltransferase